MFATVHEYSGGGGGVGRVNGCTTVTASVVEVATEKSRRDNESGGFLANREYTKVCWGPGTLKAGPQ